MLLTELLKGMEKTGPVPGTRISGLTTDSRFVSEGDLFIALRGKRFDGRDFIPQAAAGGAAAVLCEEPCDSDQPIPHIHVPGLRRQLTHLAGRFYRPRTSGLKVAAVTGTNGKTTVTHLLRETFRKKGCGLIGTLEYDLVSSNMKAFLTTPQAVEIWRFLAAIRHSGAEFCAVEVSSQGIDMGRIDGMEFSAAVFTNLTQDHLDYHGTIERYLDAKLELFRRLQENALAVINLEDPAAPAVTSCTKARTIGTTLYENNAPPGPVDAVYTGKITSNSLSGVVLSISRPEGETIDVSSPLAGRFNAMNLLQASACALEMGLEPDELIAALNGFRGPPGRLERIDAGQDFLVAVDYAHTPDALENVLRTLRPLAEDRLIVVFGCGGDRDRTKRPIMGRIASRLADLVVVTSDNPRTENPGDIIREIEAGLEATSRVLTEPDRGKAIRLAISRAQPGDVILIAGKGHEDYQEINQVRYPLDDRKEAREALREAGYD